MKPIAPKKITPVQLAEAERAVIQHYDQTLLKREGAIPALADGPVRNLATFDDMLPPEHETNQMRIAEASLRLHAAYTENVRLAALPARPAPRCAPQELVRRVTGHALSLGLSQIAYTDVPQRFIFSGKAIPYPNAFVFTQAMDVEIFKNGPDVNLQIHVAEVYGSLSAAANRLTQFIQDLGYPAVPNPALAGAVLYPPMAAYAGLGYPGRNGLLISPDNGPCQRVGAVFVDLPLEPHHTENPHRWIEDFCQKCGKCVRKCPSGAIRETPELRPNDGLSCTDYEKCSAEYKLSFSCGICIKVCPFTTNSYEKLKSRFF